MSAVENRISAIIVTHNSMPLLEDCLEGLKAALHHLEHEVIVVDNNSSDHSATVAARHFPGGRVLTNRDNRGFAAACNQGAGIAGGEFLLFLNPDVRVDLDGVRNILAVFARKDRIGLAGARLRHPSGTFQATCRRFPTVENLLFSRGSFFARLPRTARKRDTHRYTMPDFHKTTIVDAVAGTMAMIRRDLFWHVGGFDERFFMYMEDTDLSLRLVNDGYVNVFVPASGGVHHWRKGSNAGRLRRRWHHHRSVWKYFRKHEPGTYASLVLPVLLAANFLLTSLLPEPRRGA
ncbi:MAG TPA: glycosyltransferase family 2 protein [Acidobacteriota bacterium]|nr:glycosyltransferase family 2 protein [Acidobacteriota bacterium]